MRGEFIGVWSEMWQNIWVPLVDEPYEDNDEFVPDDIFCELYRNIAGEPKKTGALKNTPSIETLVDIIDDPLLSREAFENIKAEELSGELSIVNFLESVYDILDEFGGENLTNRYFNLIAAFIEKFNLRYDLRRSCTLCPTLPGIFSSLFHDLREITSTDPILDKLMKAYENALRDLRYGCSEDRIQTCFIKQTNLLEAIGIRNDGVTKSELGQICKQINTWPHPGVNNAIGNLYGFTSSCPGIRHGTGMVGREIDMRDLIAISVLFTGFTPYLSEQLNPDHIYQRP